MIPRAVRVSAVPSSFDSNLDMAGRGVIVMRLLRVRPTLGVRRERFRLENALRAVYFVCPTGEV